MQVQRKKATRLFHGVAGSPLSQANEIATAAPLTGAQRQKLFRERNAEKVRKADAARKAAKRAEEKEAAENDLPVQKKKWNQILADEGLAVSKGAYLLDAPSGKGKLVSGGYDPTKIDIIEGIRESDTGRVTPQGACPKHFEEGGKIVAGAKGTKYIPTPTLKFIVRLNNHEFDGIIANLVDEHFEKAGDKFRCSLCETEVDWHRDRNRHIEDIHIDLVMRIARDIDKADRKLRREGKKALELRNEQELAALRAQAKAEGWRQRTDGTWHKAVTDK